MSAFSNNKLLVSLGILSTLLILMLNSNVFYWADDYAILNEINDFGVYQRCISGFYNWDGRYMTPAAFFQGVFLSTLPVGVITLIWNLCFLLSGFLLYFIIKRELAIPNRTVFYLPLLICTIFWLGSYPHIAQTVYWATGGVYSFNLLIGAIWLYWFYGIKTPYSYANRILFLLLTILIGLTTQNLTVGLMTLLLLEIVSDSLKKENGDLKFNLLLLLLIFAGTLFISTAPGNFVRLNEIDASSDISLVRIFRNFVLILYIYLKISAVLILLSLCAAIVWLTESGKKISFTIRNVLVLPKTKWQNAAFIDNYKFLAAAVSTILPLVTIPDVASPRTAIYFMFFLFLFLVKWVTVYGASPASGNKTGILRTVTVCILFCSVIVFTIFNFQKGLVLKSEITKREKILKNSKNRTVVIPLIEESLKPPCYDFREFRGNDDWALEAQREYFGIQKIILE